MLPEVFTLADDFPPVTYEAWRELVEADLKGASFEQKLVTHTYEGIDIQPVYTRRDALADDETHSLPGFRPFVRGASPLGAVLTGWDLRQEYAHPDLTVVNQSILADLEGGVTSLLLRLDRAARGGRDPDQAAVADMAGDDGLMAYTVADLETALTGVHLNMVGVALEAGGAFVPAAAALTALWRRRGVSADEARGAFNADPLAALARDGELPLSTDAALSQLADLARFTAVHFPHVTAVGVDTSPYHHAGATAAQDLAFGMATGVQYLRAMIEAGMSIDDAASQFTFRISLGTHHFLAISKLRAARRLWSRVVGASGGSASAGAMRIHARTSRRVLTQRDPYVNMLRNTVGVFAAGIGGAETITSVPFDMPVGLPSDFSRRIARNTLLILQEESHLHRVVDPAGGSWFLDRTTQQLADAAWKIFQQIERQGGMLSVLESGWAAEQIDSAFAPRAKDIARRKEGITGVSEFPNVAEEPVVHPPVDPTVLRGEAARRIAAATAKTPALASLTSQSDMTASAVKAAEDGATLGRIAAALGFHDQRTAVAPLEVHSFAEPFEVLRDASDAYQAEHGRRPRVFLVNMGPVAHYTARATYSKNFFEAGGFEVVSGDGFRDADAAVAALRDSGASTAVICSSDKLYADIVPDVAPKLKAAGAKVVVLAGHPGENEKAWRASGVDRFIFIKCDVLATLRDMLREEGVAVS
ncbi:MAG: methylmalonyl-CoA mutase family protein [Pirellulaceae bacterium]